VDLAELARRVASGPEQVLVVDSHGDLDRKNTLLRADGTLLALDWDAAGPVGAVHEAAGLALDWSDGDPAIFAKAVSTYTRRSGVAVAAQPWIFAGWVAAQGGWLDYNAAQRGGSPLGRAEVTGTLARLRRLAADLDTLLDAMRRNAPA
jgi:thiamine kinase-like enzyme